MLRDNVSVVVVLSPLLRMVAITPPPNDIASFGVQTIPRLLWLVPSQRAVVDAVASLTEPGVRGVAIIAFAGLTTALQPVTWTGKLFDYNVPACAIIAAIAMLAAVSSKPFSSASARFQPRSIGGFSLSLRVLAVLYALILIPIGLQDMVRLPRSHARRSTTAVRIVLTN